MNVLGQMPPFLNVVVVIITLVALYYLLGLNTRMANVNSFSEWIRFILLWLGGGFLMGLFLIKIIGLFYVEMKEQVVRSPIVHDITGIVVNDPASLGLTGDGSSGIANWLDGVNTGNSVTTFTGQPETPTPTPIAVQQPVVQQEQVFPKPERIVFLLSARLPSGKTEDICAVDWTKSTDGLVWVPDIIVLCNDKDEPGNETVSANWNQLEIVSGIFVPVVEAQPAMILPPTPVPTPKPPPTPTPLSQSEWNRQCGQLWSTWAASKALVLAGAGPGDSDVAKSLVFIPSNTTWSLTGPGGFWDSTFTSEKDEVWTLSNPDLGVIDYHLRGDFARRIQGADDSDTIPIAGAGSQCLELGFPVP